MSDMDSREARNDRAAQLDAEAAAWVRRQHFEDWSAQEQAALDSWLAESIRHQVAYWRISAGFESTERLAVLRSQTHYEAISPRRRKSATGIFRIMAGLAIVCVVVAGGFVLTPQQKAYSTTVGGHEIVRLADGTQIELNTDTGLRTVTDIFGQRTVLLDRGEAFFSVKHDDDHPFVVLAAGHRLTDLGTKFVVRTEASRVRVTLMEGAIRLDSEDGSVRQRATLVPGDVAIASANSLSVKKESAPELQRAESWRRGLLVFRRTKLEDAVAEFNRYNIAKMRIEGSELAKLEIGGTFNAGAPGLFVRAASTMLGLHVVNRGNETVIAR